jgi:ATP-binding cassette, subfamily B, bacterial
MGIGTFFDDLDAPMEHAARTYLAVTDVERAMTSARLREAHRAPHRGTSPPAAGGHGPVPNKMAERELCLDDVSFGYPGSSRPVLSGLDLRIAPGSSLAIVGFNGAGKTTLMKLLCRFYEPDRGRITVGGIDIRSIPAAEWQASIAALFQDFARYELPATDNIGFGAPALLTDPMWVRGAARRAGALGFLDELPAGLATPLSRSYAGGADLSAGQWQRVALARALLALDSGRPLALLDEPTANLDARAEAEFFGRFLDLTRGATTIVVSHRFATVRRADRIVVLDGGAVTEDGTHEELIAAGGQYAQMFALQAAAFTDIESGGAAAGEHADAERQ